MKESYKVVLLMLGVSGVLWFGVARFLGGTAGLPDLLGIQDMPRLDMEAMAARLEAEKRELEQNPPAEVRDSAGSEAGPPGRDGEDGALTVASVADESGPGVEPARDASVTHAVDVALSPATIARCPRAADANVRTGVMFRRGSAAIRGLSLIGIDAVLAVREACGGGVVVVEANPRAGDEAEDDEDEGGADAALASRRLDEVKYYLLQRRVPSADIALGERS